MGRTRGIEGPARARDDGQGEASDCSVSTGEGQECGNQVRCCRNCVYAVPLRDGRRKMLVCTNRLALPGEMGIVKHSDNCRQFKKRRPRSGRTVPPAPPNDKICYIPLTKGKYAIIDAKDYERVSKHTWCVSGSGKRWYAYCNCRGKTLAMHRFLTNCPKGMVVDHIDGNGLNNRQCNLRVCTQRQNLYNSRPKGKSSRYKGVCRDRKRWVVYIRYNGRTVPIGRFDDEVEAARAYDRMAFKLFGEFAYLNFPDEIRTWGQKVEGPGPEASDRRITAAAAEP